MENSIDTILGFATKAGATLFGMEGVCRGVRSGKIRLVVWDTGLSGRSQKDVKAMCEYYSVPQIAMDPPGRLERCCGRKQNKIVGITQKSFADRLMELDRERMNSAEV